jgi:hypothetical protein
VGHTATSPGADSARGVHENSISTLPRPSSNLCARHSSIERFD